MKLTLRKYKPIKEDGFWYVGVWRWYFPIYVKQVKLFGNWAMSQDESIIEKYIKTL